MCQRCVLSAIRTFSTEGNSPRCHILLPGNLGHQTISPATLLPHFYMPSSHVIQFQIVQSASKIVYRNDDTIITIITSDKTWPDVSEGLGYLGYLAGSFLKGVGVLPERSWSPSRKDLAIRSVLLRRTGYSVSHSFPIATIAWLTVQ